jgi:hypothetical protein
MISDVMGIEKYLIANGPKVPAPDHLASYQPRTEVTED